MGYIKEECYPVNNSVGIPYWIYADLELFFLEKYAAKEWELNRIIQKPKKDGTK